jgi:hypothetical protein
VPPSTQIFDHACSDRQSVQNTQEPRRKSGRCGFSVLAFGSTVHVEAESEETCQLFARYVYPSLPRLHTPPDRPDIHVRVLEGINEFQLVLDDVLVESSAEPRGLLRGLIDCLDREVVHRLTNLHAVHAGAVLLGDRALLLPGASHAGKSSLVAELLRRGARCFSDEYALIDSDGRVHVYPRPLLIRNGRPKQDFVLPEDYNASLAESPAYVGWILSLQYEASGHWNIAEVPQSLAMLSLLQNTPHALVDSPGMVASFERAVARAACYAGHRAEAAETVDRIFRLAYSSN